MLKKIWCCVKYYRRSASACWLLLLYFILTVYVGFANVRFNQSIGLALTDFDNLMVHAPVIVWWCGSWGVANIAASIALSWSADYCFTVIFDLTIEQILGMKYKEYVKYSVSYINETTNACSEMVDGIISIVHAMGNLVRLGVLFYGIWQAAPGMIPYYLISYLVGGVVVFFSYRVFDKRIGELRATQRARNKELGECIDGFSEVRAFCTQSLHMKSMKALNAKAFNIRMNAKFRLNSANGVFTLLEIVGIVLGLRYIANGDPNAAIAGGTSLIMTVMNMTYALDSFLSGVTDVAKNTIHVPDFMTLMGSELEPIDGLKFDTFDNNIEFQEVSFGYDKTSTVLDGINLKIRKGEKIGICGLSGGGKSTLLKLLPRFYVPTSGKILIDGVDINRIEAASLRNKMGIVSQDPHLFNASIKENVSYGSTASDSEIIEACKKANLYEFINQLPDRFDTIVGPRGFKLSGGQKQRISLARVFLKNPDIVLLDEATSALDNEAESIVQESLEQLSGKTVITVAHRLTTIQSSDRILVINDHKIVEEGTHQDLIEKNGIYAKLSKRKERGA